jgi:AmiR/NasT family two-component response regulator
MKWTGTRIRRCGRIVTAVLAVALLSTVASAQSNSDREQMLEDFVFYTLTANPDLAAASAASLSATGITDAELAELLDNSTKTTVERYEDAVVRALQMDALADIAAALDKRVETGRLDLARDSQRIEQAIQMLVGTQRQKLLARGRLDRAGEYAVPALLRELTEGKDERLKNQCITVLQSIGRQAVTPLCAAVQELGDPVVERIVCDVLGSIGWPNAAPTLAEIAASDAFASPVRAAANRALGRLGVSGADVSGLYGQLALQYMDENESLFAFPNEDTNNVWSYDAFAGLEMNPVPTAIFGEVMAMKTAVHAVQLNPDNRDALALFVAANLKRENELPAGATDPVFGEETKSPEFYATVYGTSICLDVLAMGLDRVNTPLVRDAIAALSATTGGTTLLSGEGGRQPLLEALRYPDRRTQYDAALTLGRALPGERFSGDFAIVPILASSVRSGSDTHAVVIADDEEDRRTIAGSLESMGFQVAGEGASVADLRAAVAEAIGIDLVIVKHGSPEATETTIKALRVEPATTAAPILAQVQAVDLRALRDEYRGDHALLIAPASGAVLGAQVDSVMGMTGGRMDDAEAEIYAIEALSTLRDIAIANTPAYNILDAESTLAESLEIRTGGTRLMVADIMAFMDSPRAQQRLLDAAMNASGGEQIELLGRVATSVKRFGNRAEDRHVQALADLASASSGDLATAAAQVIGALNVTLPNAVELLPAGK